MGLGSVMQTALTGMNAATAGVQVAAHNLANLQTPGFKASRVLLASHSPRTLFIGGLAGAGHPVQIGGGVVVAGTEIDFAQGQVVATDETALWALQGEGMFILEDEGGRRLYSRSGHFQLNRDGELATKDGQRVLGYRADADRKLDTSRLATLRHDASIADAEATGESGGLRRYTIRPDGRIVGHYGDGTQRLLGQLRLARFPNPGGLLERSSNTYRATPASGLPIELNPGENGTAEVVAGATELSNVDLGRELIDLTLAGTQFRANLSVFYTADVLLDELYSVLR